MVKFSVYLNRNVFVMIKHMLWYSFKAPIRYSGSVVERPLCDREAAGSIPDRVIPKTLKMVLAALSLGAQHYESRVRTAQLSEYNVTGWNIMSKCMGRDISVR